MTHSDNLDGTFTNPLIHADYPDPDIICVGNDFFMVSSSFTTVPGVPVCQSKDLVNWTIIGHAYNRLPASNPAYSLLGGKAGYRGGSWAPSIRYRGGRFYICFCMPAEGFFMCIADRAQGPYEMIPFGTELYDPSLFFDDDGRAYVAHGANGLWLTELSADARSIKSPAVFIAQTAFGSPTEGSHLYKREGFYYWCITSRGYNGIQICMRSRQICGPYQTRVICADDMNYAGAGLHQGGFVDTPAGETWFFMFQDRDWIGRVPVLLPVKWIDGWPTLGDAINFGKVPVTCPKPAGLPPMPAAIPEGSDDFAAAELGLGWQWNHNPDDTKWSLMERAGFLRLHSSPAEDFLHARNTLTQKMVGPECGVRVSLDISGLKDNDIAGLAVLGFPYDGIAIWHSGGVRQIVMLDKNKMTVAAVELPAELNTLHLGCRANLNGEASFTYSLDNRAFTAIGTSLAMQFSVKSFLGNRFALFCFNRGHADGGFADFDSFILDEIRPANHYLAFRTVQAAWYDAEFGIDTQRFGEKSPRQRVVDIDGGDWICFNSIDFDRGANSFTAHASAIGDGGAIEIRLGKLDGALVGTCRIAATGVDRWQAPFIDHVCAISPISGVNQVYLRFVGTGRGLFWLEYFTFH